LRKYQGGKYCTLPHVIELMQVEYDKLFSVLRTEPGTEVLINPFISAYVHDAMDQLEGQIASARSEWRSYHPHSCTMCFPEMILPLTSTIPKTRRLFVSEIIRRNSRFSERCCHCGNSFEQII